MEEDSLSFVLKNWRADHLIFGSSHLVEQHAEPRLGLDWLGLSHLGLLTWLASGQLYLNYLRGKHQEGSKGTASIYNLMAPTWWYKIFSGPLNIPDSYGILFWRMQFWTTRGLNQGLHLGSSRSGWTLLACERSIFKGSSRSEETLILSSSLLDMSRQAVYS